MMNFKICSLLFLLATINFIVNSLPIEPTVSEILFNEYQLTDDGYSFAYATSDGQTRNETATRQPSADGLTEILSIQGSYSYIGDDGITYTVDYIADENGYRAFGEHIPGDLPISTRISTNAVRSLVGK